MNDLPETTDNKEELFWKLIVYSVLLSPTLARHHRPLNMQDFSPTFSSNFKEKNFYQQINYFLSKGKFNYIKNL